MRCSRMVVPLVCLVSLVFNAAWLAQHLASPHEYHERDPGSGVTMSFAHAPVIESRRTPFQHVEVRHSPFFGNILVIDDDLMLTQRDERGYHEMATHVPLAYIPDARTVVIIGGGDGGVCSQVLRHPNVARVVMVEIDAQVVDVSVRHFPEFAHCFADPRVTLVMRDGAAWAAEAASGGAASCATAPNGDPGPTCELAKQVDVVIVDSTDFNQAESLFTVQFYTHIRALLSPDKGIVVSNLSSLSWNLRGCARAVRRQRRIFDVVVPYQVFQPTYMSGHYGYLFCSMGVNPLSDVVDWRAWADKEIETKYYTPAVHWAAFALPPFVETALPAFQSLSRWVPMLDPSRFPTSSPFHAQPRSMRGQDAGVDDVVVAADGRVVATAAALGEHLIAELVGVPRGPFDALNNEAFLRAVMNEAAEASGLTVVGEQFHSFSPHGVTGVLLLAESHMSVHTWPEYGYAAVDVFSCVASAGEGRRPNVSRAVKHLCLSLAAKDCHVQALVRGGQEHLSAARAGRGSGST